LPPIGFCFAKIAEERPARFQREKRAPLSAQETPAFWQATRRAHAPDGVFLIQTYELNPEIITSQRRKQLCEFP